MPVCTVSGGGHWGAAHPVVPSCSGHLSQRWVAELRGCQEPSLCGMERERGESAWHGETREKEGGKRAEETGQAASGGGMDV